jgi:uncharacterized membrane protein
LFALVFAVLLVAIFWSIVMYFSEMGNEHGKKHSKEMILNTVTYLFLLMCAYAVVDWIRTSLGF